MWSCPIPIDIYPKVIMSHGSGGRLMQQLIEDMFITSFSNDLLLQRHDGAVFDTHLSKMAMTSDSFVVSPLIFPGGNIGDLAVNGTVNDLAMCGAKPLYLSLSLIIEEGLEMQTLWEVVKSIRIACKVADVKIITGDTKVVERGKGDGIYINTCGVGAVSAGCEIAPEYVQSEDIVLLYGDIGRHGIAIMSIREGIDLQSNIVSDTAPVYGAVKALQDCNVEIHCLRDVTRGGLAGVLNEIAGVARLQIIINEDSLYIAPEVRQVCELLGLEAVHIANEGCFVAFIPQKHEHLALEALRQYNKDINCSIIGKVIKSDDCVVVMNTPISGTRVINVPSGELLPRIC